MNTSGAISNLLAPYHVLTTAAATRVIEALNHFVKERPDSVLHLNKTISTASHLLSQGFLDDSLGLLHGHLLGTYACVT